MMSLAKLGQKTRAYWPSYWGLLLVVMLVGSAWGDEKEAKVRSVLPVYGAGRWYPADGGVLRRMIQESMESARLPAIRGAIVAAVSPHAGYMYCRKVAGCTFRALEANAQAGYRPQLVVVLGFSHWGGFPGVALMDADAVKTPLGELPLDREAGLLMTGGSKRIFLGNKPHRGEHSAENLLPFLQEALPGIRAVVAIMGDHNPATVRDTVKALKVLSTHRRIVVVASSDMLHDPDYEKVSLIDQGTLERMRLLDIQGLAKAWEPSHQILCGIGPVLVAMEFAAAQGVKEGTVLCYQNSGDLFPQSRGRWVVGYGSVIFSKKAPKKSSVATP